MAIKAKLVKYGNSLAVTLNSSIVRELYGWKKGGNVVAEYDATHKTVTIREATP